MNFLCSESASKLTFCVMSIRLCFFFYLRWVSLKFFFRSILLKKFRCDAVYKCWNLSKNLKLPLNVSVITEKYVLRVMPFFQLFEYVLHKSTGIETPINCFERRFFFPPTHSTSSSIIYKMVHTCQWILINFLWGKLST